MESKALALADGLQNVSFGIDGVQKMESKALALADGLQT
jgi:hypothetical protein